MPHYRITYSVESRVIVIEGLIIRHIISLMYNIMVLSDLAIIHFISITGFKQYNLTVQQLQSDLQNQVIKVQEKIANLTVAGDQLF